MISSRTLFSHCLEINPQTLTQVPLIAWMDHEGCKEFHHLKGKAQVLLQLNPIKFSLIFLSFGFLDIFARIVGIYLFSLEARMSSTQSLILVTRNSQKSKAKLSCPIPISQSLYLGFLSKLMNH